MMKKHCMNSRYFSSFEEIVEGEGAEAQEGDVVEFNYVCRRSNGYFVHR